MKKIKKYAVTFDSDVYAISLVEDPAIEENFIFLNADKPLQICLDKEDKHLIVGAVLVPDKPIYRNQGGEEFYIQFSKETIEKLAYEYMMKGRMWSVTEDHLDIADDVVMVESWLKTSENDKSNEYGMSHLPVGSWIVAMKCNNEDVWSRVKNGELRGFSVESFVNLEEINLSKNMIDNKMEAVEINETFWDKLKAIIADLLGKGEEAPEVTEVVEEIADEVKPVEEIVEMAEEEKAEEPEETTPIEEEEQANEDDKIKELEEVINQLEKDLEEKMNQIEELEKSNAKLSKQPSVDPIKIEASKQENGYSFMDFASGKMRLK